MLDGWPRVGRRPGAGARLHGEASLVEDREVLADVAGIAFHDLAQFVDSGLSGGLDLGDDLVLTHLRLLRHDEIELQLDPDEVEVSNVFIGDGKGAGYEPKKESLAELIAAINERFGTDLDERDRLEAEKVQITLSADAELKTYAMANPIDNFALEFSAKFKTAILDTEAHTERLYNLLLTNPELSAMIEAEVMKATYHSMRDTADEHPGAEPT